jgi:hypothetical protein
MISVVLAIKVTKKALFERKVIFSDILPYCFVLTVGTTSTCNKSYFIDHLSN